MVPTFFIGRKLERETKNWLIQNAVDFEEHSLIHIEFVQPETEKLVEQKKYQTQFVVSSKWGAKWLVQNLSKVNFSGSDQVFCLSEKQKEILKLATKNVFVSKMKNSASLVKLVMEKNTSETVVFLHGNKTQDSTSSKLNAAGIRFLNLEVYKNSLLKNKINRNFNVYLFFSPSGVESFIGGGNSVLPDSKIVAIGKTTATFCRQYFQNKIYISEIQEELAVTQYAVELNKDFEIKS